MNRLLMIGAGLALLSLVTGCPYTANVPLADPVAHSIDPRLIGSWVGTVGDGDSTRIRILAFNDSEYYAETIESNGAASRYRTFVFDAGGQPFLQINELSTDVLPAEYGFARYSFSPDGVLTMRFVGEKIVPKAMATDRPALLAFLAGHRNDPALDDDGSTLVLTREAAKTGAVDGKSGQGGTAKP